MKNYTSYIVRRTLYIILAFLPVVAYAASDRNGKTKLKRGEVLYALPEPDALLAVPLPDHPLPSISELRPFFHHTVSQHQGIDVSHYQGHINWERVAYDKDIKFVYVKATEGAGYVDDLYLRNLYGAKRVGIPVGVYHFFSSTVSPLVQLENFRTNVDPRQQDLIPIVDVEKCSRRVSIPQFQGRLRAFLEGVERMFGVKPIIYTGINFYAKYLEGRFKGYRFMVARYADEFPGLSEEVPILLWQYTSSSHVDGIKGNVDRSVFLDRYSVADIMYRK